MDRENERRLKGPDISENLIKRNNDPISLEEAIQRIFGYYEGKIAEIGEELEEVKRWPTGVRLGSTVRRKESELACLERLKTELEHSQQYVLRILSAVQRTRT